ncbi:RNA polymerase sigma factor SigJ [Amycolatopsis albispora]|uniref:RNA polymerase subunit sigma-24 n=1 Tax=Amycolatopsis albispora TaxID=1804986 RepID=A0A344L0U3_9PSEU|nr:RNA polymerase sigma factor SigJ [Amycolatopsis albispora]AXB41667.1 RNA polymerase subunit sigma-24 [Amycolatopsis albispora]
MTTTTDPGLSERHQLVNVAYRLLGSLAEAEDVVQEAYARWYALPAAQRAAIEAPGGWLTKVAARLCLNLLGSARVRRERYVGDWLPEPLPEPGGDPADRVALDESVTMAFLVVLDSMTPAERVAFVLHDVFRYPFTEVAEILGRSPAACRQLATSARRRVRTARKPAPAARQAEVVRKFKRAWEAGDIGALVGLLDPGVTAVGDGGGRAGTRRSPVEGAEELVRYLLAIAERLSALELAECTVNGQPGLLARENGVTVTVYAFDLDGERIRNIWAVRNPEKLRLWNTRRAGAA